MVILIFYMSAVVFLGVLAEISTTPQFKIIYLKCVFLFALLYSGLRGRTVGLDTNSTCVIFENVARSGLSGMPRNTQIEKGYMLLDWILSRIINNPQMIIIVTSAVICYGFYILIRDYSENYMLSSLIFVTSIFTITMNVSRQYLALAFVFFAIRGAVEKKTLRTICLILLACSMHYSAIVFLPIILIAMPKINFNRKMLIIVGALSFFAIPLYMSLITVFTSVFPQYSRFLDSARYGAESNVSVGLVCFLLIIVLLGLYSVLPFRIKGHIIQIERNLEETSFMDNDNGYTQYEMINLIFLLMLIEYIIVYFISTKIWIAGRIVYLFQSSLVIAIPNILRKLRNGKMPKEASLLLVLFILYYLNFGYHYFMNDPHGILPYVFFFNSTY